MDRLCNNMLKWKNIRQFKIIFSYDVPHLLLKKTFFQFRLKIYDTVQERECKLIHAEFIKAVHQHSLALAVKIEEYPTILTLSFRLAIKKESQTIYQIITEAERNTTFNMAKTVGDLVDEKLTDATVKISNPLFGKSREQLKKASVSSTLGLLSKMQRLIQIHENICHECAVHKPCPNNKYQGVHILSDTNELQFFFRIMAGPNSKSISQQEVIFEDSECIYDYSKQLTPEYSNILSSEIHTPENSFQLLVSIEDIEANKSGSHCLSAPITIDGVIYPEVLGRNEKIQKKN